MTPSLCNPQDDGWWTGHVSGSDESGMFPANYVLEFLPEPVEYMGLQ